MRQFGFMMCLKWTLSSLALPLVFICAPASRAALSSLPSATTFYRSSESAFPSGQANRIQLERQQVRTEQEYSYKVHWNKKDYTLKAEELLRDLQLAALVTLRENSQILEDTRSNAPAVATLSKGANLQLVATRMHWARVKNADHEGWLPLHRLEARNDDRGVYIPFMDTSLRTKAANDGRTMATIPKGTRLAQIQVNEKGWLEVKHNGQTGWVDIHHLVSRADFAVWAWRKGKGWLDVAHREGAFIKTKSGERVSIGDIVGYSPNLGRGFVLQNENPQSPPTRANVELKKTEATVWGVSDLDAHGEVWWKKEHVVVEDRKTMEGQTISTEELLKRSIFSYALTGTKKIEGLVSSEGIWKTEDGLTWTRLPSFGDQNLPVALHPDGWWLVGSQRSRDRGVSFEPFIRWDNLAQTIEFSLGRPPRYVKLQKIETKPGSNVLITVDTGIRRLSLRGSILNNFWKITR